MRQTDNIRFAEALARLKKELSLFSSKWTPSLNDGNLSQDQVDDYFVLRSAWIKLKQPMEMKATPRNYIVIWHYMANYGFNEIKAISPEMAIKNHPYHQRDDIELFAYENNIDTSAHRDIREKED